MCHPDFRDLGRLHRASSHRWPDKLDRIKPVSRSPGADTYTITFADKRHPNLQGAPSEMLAVYSRRETRYLGSLRNFNERVSSLASQRILDIGLCRPQLSASRPERRARERGHRHL